MVASSIEPPAPEPAPIDLPVPPPVVAPVPQAEPVAAPVRRSGVLTWLQERLAIAGLVAVSGFLRSFRLSEVAGQLIGDENWYVQAARVINGFPVLMHNLPSRPWSGLDPNSEHPPLAKLIMAAFMHVMGDKEIAWRIPSVILGTASIWFLYEIVLLLGGTRRQAFLASFILAFESMSFIHGRIAMLDIYMIGFDLLGAWLYLAKKPALSGVAFGLAAMCKLNGLLGLAAIVATEAFLIARDWRMPTWKDLRPWAIAIGFCVAFFLVGLGALDCYFTEWGGPFEHLKHMLSYHVGRSRLGAPVDNESTPLQWWLNNGGMNYFTWNINNGATPKSWVFRASMNEYVIIAAPVALFYALTRAWTDRSKLGAFSVAWFITAYVPVFLAWAVDHHISYIYYMLPSIPAFACAIGQGTALLPKSVQWAYAAVVLCAFVDAFPIHQLS